MKPPVRPDVPAESIQPVQPAQPVQTNQQDYKAKPVQPAHPIQQVKRAQQDQQAKPVQPVHKSVQSAHQPVQPAHQPVQPKRSTELLTQSEKYPQSKVITLSPNHSVPTTFPRLENGTARPLSPVRVCAFCNVCVYLCVVCRPYWTTLMDNNCCPCSVSLKSLF